MRDAAVVLHQLLMGQWSTLAACVVPPLLAWLAVRAAQPVFVRMERDPGWLASAATAALCAPGALVCWYAVRVVIGAFATPAPMPWWHGLVSESAPIVTVAPVVAFALVVRAGVRFVGRVVEVARLRRSTLAPSHRLAQIAAQFGVTARTLPCDEAVCFLIGIVQPVVVVSSGTLAQLDDAQLAAAVLHERAHRERHDVLWAAVVAFCLDCAPLPLGATLETYRRTRELAADRSTVREIAPDTLAAALLVLARAALRAPALRSPALVHTASLSATAALPTRLNALLTPQLQDAGVAMRRAAVTLLLAALALLAMYRAASMAAGTGLMQAYGIS